MRAPSGGVRRGDPANADIIVSAMSDRGIDPFVRRELDALIAENQRLNEALLDLERVPTLLRRTAGAFTRPVRRYLGRRSPPGTVAPAPHAPYVAHVPRASQDAATVLHVIGNMYTGGSARLVVDLAERLGDEFDHVVVARDLPAEPHYVGVRVVPTVEGAAAEALARLNPALVHIHFLGHHRHAYSELDWRWYRDWFLAAAAAGIPVVENVNIPIPPYLDENVRAYVFVSDFVRRVFAPEGAPSVTIHPGSDFSRFTSDPAAAPRRECVGMVYRLEKDKIDERAIDVLTVILQRRPGARGLVVGGGRLLEQFRAAVHAAGVASRVTFTGYVGYDELPGLYRELTLFVAPVHTESFGHVVPLAMGVGIPVVAWNTGALQEILGGDAMLAPAGDVEALADLAAGLLADPGRARTIGDANRRRAHAMFSVEAMVENYRHLYQSVLHDSTADFFAGG